MSQMEMFPEVVETETEIVATNYALKDWDAFLREERRMESFRKSFLPKRPSMSKEMLDAWRGQMKSFTYA